MNVPELLAHNPHFLRYYRTWQKNELSIVFVPLAQLCLEQGFLDQAQEICEKGLSHHADSISGRLVMARIQFEKGRIGAAKDLVDRILDEFPAQRDARVLSEKILRLQEGEKSAPSALEPPPASVSLWENVTMARIYADQGETRTALRILEKILTRNPNNEAAVRLRGELAR